MTSKTPRLEQRTSRHFLHCLVVLCLITRPTLEKVTHNDSLDGIDQDQSYNLPKPLQSLSFHPTPTKSIQNEPSHQERTKNQRPNNITKTMASVTIATRNDYVSFRSDEEHVCSVGQAIYTMISKIQHTMTNIMTPTARMAFMNQKGTVNHHRNHL
jgi:hypothetical protein